MTLYRSRDGTSSYLDGVHVKISETFRPPVKITLPISASRLGQPQSLNDDYDFSVEHAALEQAARYYKQKEEREAKAKAATAKSSPVVATPAGVATNEVLQPTLVSAVEGGEAGGSEGGSATTANSAQPPKSSGIIKEFEDDATSPFDQMELQTINDMEELSNIFGAVKVTPAVPTATQGGSYPSSVESSPARQLAQSPVSTSATTAVIGSNNPFAPGYGASFSVAEQSVTVSPPPALPTVSYTAPNVARVDLSNVVFPETASKSSAVAALIDTLPEHKRALARGFVGMGFRPWCVVRAIEYRGVDEKDVAEYLLAIQAVVDAGFSDEEAHEALMSHKNDSTKAIEHLNLVRQFLDLGFPRAQIVAALNLHDDDREKTLDQLVGA